MSQWFFFSVYFFFVFKKIIEKALECSKNEVDTDGMIIILLCLFFYDFLREMLSVHWKFEGRMRKI